MRTAVTESLVSADELLLMPDRKDYELVDGHLVPRNMGFESCYFGGSMFSLLMNHCRQRRLGWVVGPDCGYRCFSESAEKVRKPDVSFIRIGRLPDELPPKGWCEIAPDLAVEVLSPGDLDYETDCKVEDYLQAGVRLVWVVNPESRTVLVYRHDGSIIGLREKDELDGEDVVPGFRCRVVELFLTPGDAAS